MIKLNNTLCSLEAKFMAQDFEKTQNIDHKYLEIKYKRSWVQLAIEITTLFIVGISLYHTINEKKMTSEIKDNTYSIRNSIEKPLQGVWNFESSFTKYFDEKDLEELGGIGKAFIIWGPDNQYEILIGYEIVRNATKGPKITLTALTLKGSFNSKEDGTVGEQFSMSFSRIARHSSLADHPIHDYRYTNCKYDKSVDHGKVITCKFIPKSGASISEVTLRQERYISMNPNTFKIN